MNSGLLSDEMQPFEAYAQKGSNALNDSKNITRGYLCLFKQGMVFLAMENNYTKFTPTFGVEALGFGMAAQFSYLGAMALYVTSNTTRNWFSENKRIKQSYEHPDTFLIPYVEIIKAEYTVRKTFLAPQKEYLIVGRQIDKDDYREYAIRPCTYDYIDVIFARRFEFEMEALINKYLDEKLGYNNLCATVAAKYSADYGLNWASTHIDQFMKECKQLQEAKLSEMGLSYKQIHTDIMKSLTHFHSFLKATINWTPE